MEDQCNLTMYKQITFYFGYFTNRDHNTSTIANRYALNTECILKFPVIFTYFLKTDSTLINAQCMSVQYYVNVHVHNICFVETENFIHNIIIFFSENYFYTLMPFKIMKMISMF